MSCVLRISGAGPICGLVPYRVQKNTAYFLVSQAESDELPAQLSDAIAFLRLHQVGLQPVMNQTGVTGELDFAVVRRDVAVQCDAFPAELVRIAGSLGLALMFSHYP